MVFAPYLRISIIILWDIQQYVLLKITTGVSAPKLMTVAAITVVDKKVMDLRLGLLFWFKKSGSLEGLYIQGKGDDTLLMRLSCVFPDLTLLFLS